MNQVTTSDLPVANKEATSTNVQESGDVLTSPTCGPVQSDSDPAAARVPSRVAKKHCRPQKGAPPNEGGCSPHTKRALRFPQVQARTGISKTHLYRLIQQGKFPAPHKLSERVSAWDEAAVDAWLAERFGL